MVLFRPMRVEWLGFHLHLQAALDYEGPCKAPSLILSQTFPNTSIKDKVHYAPAQQFRIASNSADIQKTLSLLSIQRKIKINTPYWLMTEKVRQSHAHLEGQRTRDDCEELVASYMEGLAMVVCVRGSPFPWPLLYAPPST